VGQSDEKAWQKLHDDFEEKWFSQQYPEALRAAEEELEQAHKIFQSAHPCLIRSLLDMAMASQVNQKTAQAQEAEKKALTFIALAEKQAEEEPESLATSRWYIFEADRWSNILGPAHEKVQSLYQEALAIRQKKRGAEHPDTAEVWSRLGETALLSGQLEQAQKHYHQALTIYERSKSTEQPMYLKSLEGLAQTLQGLEKYSEAAVLFDQLLKVAEEKGKEKKSFYALLSAYADCLNHLKRPAQAQKLMERAQALLPQTNPGAFGFQN
jgi:tetratricopeptide (TPR) repeat protein